jgi:hypothetical protein
MGAIILQGPFSPKINDHWLVGFEHVGFKSGVGCVFDQIAGHGLFLVEIEITANLVCKLVVF